MNESNTTEKLEFGGWGNWETWIVAMNFQDTAENIMCDIRDGDLMIESQDELKEYFSDGLWNEINRVTENLGNPIIYSFLHTAYKNILWGSIAKHYWDKYLAGDYQEEGEEDERDNE